MNSNSSNTKRRQKDIHKLIMSNYEVIILNENKMNEMYIIFKGPGECPYEDVRDIILFYLLFNHLNYNFFYEKLFYIMKIQGFWKILVTLQDEYPFKSPSIGFINKIFHPNIDEISGSVCLDVINQTWSPMYDLVNIFETFLPQLLLYPNPSDPLNASAAKLLKDNPEKYDRYVREHVKNNAKKRMYLDKTKNLIVEDNDCKNNNNNNSIGKTCIKNNNNNIDNINNDKNRDKITNTDKKNSIKKNKKNEDDKFETGNKSEESVISEASIGEIGELDDNWD